MRAIFKIKYEGFNLYSVFKWIEVSIDNHVYASIFFPNTLIGKGYRIELYHSSNCVMEGIESLKTAICKCMELCRNKFGITRICDNKGNEINEEICRSVGNFR